MLSGLEKNPAMAGPIKKVCKNKDNNNIRIET